MILSLKPGISVYQDLRQSFASFTERNNCSGLFTLCMDVCLRVSEPVESRHIDWNGTFPNCMSITALVVNNEADLEMQPPK